MKSHRKELWFNTPVRRSFVNITPEVERCVGESGTIPPPMRAMAPGSAKWD